MLCIESRQFAATEAAFNLTHLHLAPPVVVTPFEFAEFRHKETRVLWLSCGVVCVILRLAVSAEHRLVTDAPTDRQT